MTGVQPAEHPVELVETATAVSGVAITETKPTDEAGWWVAAGVTRRLPARLREPIGNRVFVDLLGEAMEIVFSTD